MKKVISFLGLTIMWFLAGIIIMVGSPIFAWLGLKSWTDITKKSEKIRDAIEEHERMQVAELGEDTRALLEGDELLRGLNGDTK